MAIETDKQRNERIRSTINGIKSGELDNRLSELKGSDVACIRRLAHQRSDYLEKMKIVKLSGKRPKPIGKCDGSVGGFRGSQFVAKNARQW